MSLLWVSKKYRERQHRARVLCEYVPRDKYAAFKRIVDFNPDIFGIVFCRTKIETQDIAEALIKGRL